MSGDLEPRWAQKSEAEAISKWAEQFTNIKDFGYLWKRWEYWETCPPHIMTLDGQYVAYHAARYQRRGCYVNSFYFGVVESCRGLGLGGMLVNACLQHAILERGLTRLKMKAKHNSLGRVFWEGFGVRPFAVTDVEAWYDVDITDCTDVPALMAHMADTDAQRLTLPKDVVRNARSQAPLVQLVDNWDKGAYTVEDIERFYRANPRKKRY